MTNISNYGPARRMSPPVSAERKPYSRTGLKGVLGTLDLNSGDAVVPPTLDSPYYPFHVEIPQLEAPNQSRFTVPDGSRDIAGFPTYEQYQRIEEEYLTSLSERKQPKALISQSLFDKVYAVLQNGSEDRGSTAQFRFWVRKMFVLAYPQTSFNPITGQTPEAVVLHDKRPVAIKERLYEVLCYCHAIARHGGRDKTCATLRLHYSWVPKELTAKFVKACPTCTLKRSGNPDFLSQFNYAPQPYLQTAPEPTLQLSGGPSDSSPGLNLIGPSGYDNNNAGASGFTPSIFATPDLSVYPSPTLSSGSGGGPMTPSPYLHNGLFGYPAVFDPGHNSLSSVAGWDPSPSPCVPGYAGGSDEPLLREATEQQQQQPGSADDEPIDSQLHLPTPRKARKYDFSTRDEPPPSSIGTEGTERSSTPPPGVLDNIDPALFMEGFPTPGPGPARRADTDANEGPSAPWETPIARAFPSLCLLLHLPSRPSSRTSCGPALPPPLLSPPPVPTCERGCSAGTMFAPVPLEAAGRMKSVLCSMMEAEAETETEIEEGEVVEMAISCRSKRWESPEAWLVPSDSADEADAISG
ncbi:hypothetical protein EDB85DRAFT_2035449 [Lactarius pseudohatsudake]|nr:hypothetical protein EDB85DRAFT_2035449 [Lactarius pseudohatsudake]